MTDNRNNSEQQQRELPTAEALEGGGFEGPPHSLWYDAWKRLKKDKLAVLSAGAILLLIFLAVSADLWCKFGVLRHPTEYDDLERNNEGPSGDYWMGTDTQGRDVLSRCVYGTRISLRIAILTQLLALSIGITVGSIGGYFGGWIDDIVTWLISVFWAFPFILFVIGLSLIVRNFEIFGTPILKMHIGKWYFGNELALSFAIAFVGWVAVARIVRAQFISLRDADYVDAARALGTGPLRIIIRHILPNSLAPIIVVASLQVAMVIMSEAALSFLGIGIDRPNPSWGRMISDSWLNLDYWWQYIFPSLFLMLTVFAFNLFGDGLRDALDPKQQIT